MDKSLKYYHMHQVLWAAGRTLACMVGAIVIITGLPMIAAAQGFPTKPITVIYPFPPGNPAENKLRLMYAEAARTLGQPIVTEYRPGAGGRLGALAVQKAPPDGYLLSFIVDPVMTVMPHASPTFKLQVDKDYVAVHQPYGVSLASPQAITAQIKAEYERMGPLVKRLNLKFD